jgi:hypothetical protein
LEGDPELAHDWITASSSAGVVGVLRAGAAMVPVVSTPGGRGNAVDSRNTGTKLGLSVNVRVVNVVHASPRNGTGWSSDAECFRLRRLLPLSAVSRALDMSTSLLRLILPRVFSSFEVFEGASSVHPSGLFGSLLLWL